MLALRQEIMMDMEVAPNLQTMMVSLGSEQFEVFRQSRILKLGFNPSV